MVGNVYLPGQFPGIFEERKMQIVLVLVGAIVLIKFGMLMVAVKLLAIALNVAVIVLMGMGLFLLWRKYGNKKSSGTPQ